MVKSSFLCCCRVFAMRSETAWLVMSRLRNCRNRRIPERARVWVLGDRKPSFLLRLETEAKYSVMAGSVCKIAFSLVASK